MLSEVRAIGHLANHPDVRVAVSGASAEGAARAAAELVESGAPVMVSFGLCGGLSSSLQTGDVVVARELVFETGDPIPLDDLFLERATAGRALAVAEIVKTVAQKITLHRETGADIIDMESGALIRAAKETTKVGLLRVVADPTEAALPESVDGAIGPLGHVRHGAVLRSLLRKPSDLPALLRTGRDARRALQKLRQMHGMLESLLARI
ncbi:MAG: hypothetical protein AAF666_12460 [Pseudomonadota bacterium]